jgi:hypothetical protein
MSAMGGGRGGSRQDVLAGPVYVHGYGIARAYGYPAGMVTSTFP